MLSPSGALSWLVPWLREARAAELGGHVQTRWNRQSRRLGGIQIYLGRTSPLEIRGRARGQVRLHADRFYREISPSLFGQDLLPAQCAAMAPELQRHLEDAAERTHRSFLDGEAVVHAGLVRRYGLLAGAARPFLALDTEARVGFDSKLDQHHFEVGLPGLVGLPPGEEMPRKLDLVAVTAEGGLLLVEVKADATGLQRAAWQVAVHVARFRALLASTPTWFSEVAGGLARQKQRVGLLGSAPLPNFTVKPRIHPVIAAPDLREDWGSQWRGELRPVLEASGQHLTGLRLWRLSPSGQLLEELLA